MKILINNYSNSHSTEPIYLNTAFNAAGCESTLWPSNVSTFDIFDMVQPNIHITHHSKLTIDLATYLKEAKNIDFIINITGLNQDHLIAMEEKLLSFNIKPKLYFVNHYDHNLKSNRVNIMTLLHGADIFFGKGKKQYSINSAILIDNKDQIYPYGDTYHYLSVNDQLVNDVDICMPLHHMSQLWGNYDKIIIRYFNNSLSQIFYDAAYYNNNVYFDLKDRTLLDYVLAKMLGEGKHCDLNIQESGNVSDKIKQKHTCLHRAKSLLSQLPRKEQIDKLNNIIEGIL